MQESFVGNVIYKKNLDHYIVDFFSDFEKTHNIFRKEIETMSIKPFSVVYKRLLVHFMMKYVTERVNRDAVFVLFSSTAKYLSEKEMEYYARYINIVATAFGIIIYECNDSLSDFCSKFYEHEPMIAVSIYSKNEKQPKPKRIAALIERFQLLKFEEYKNSYTKMLSLI